MKHFLVVFLLVTSLAFAQKGKTAAPKAAAKAEGKTSVVIKSPQDKLSYALGYNIATRIFSDFSRSQIFVAPDPFVAGIRDVFNGQNSALPDSEFQAVLMKFQMEMQAKQQEENKKAAEVAEKAKKEGEEFLAKNKLKDSVKVTASGLQYKILREGTGKTAVDTNIVRVHYRGKLLNGEVFDESYARGEPAEFRLNQVIKGWVEGVKFIKVGGKIELYIPSELGYGDRGSGSIPPGATLIFEVELLDIK